MKVEGHQEKFDIVVFGDEINEQKIKIMNSHFFGAPPISTY